MKCLYVVLNTFFWQKIFPSERQKVATFGDKIMYGKYKLTCTKMTTLLSYIVLRALIMYSLYSVGLMIYLDLKNNRVRSQTI